MSAKEHNRIAPVVLPVLPPEIWLSIFRFATWSKDIFNPRLMVFSGYDISHHEQLREFKISLVSSKLVFVRTNISLELHKITKKYLVRVCKAWYCLASPFLFEYIFLGKGRVLAPLRDGMLRSERDVELQELPHNMGWWTQRIDVHIRDRSDNPKLIMDALVGILRRLPNLRILTFAVTGHGYDFDSKYFYHLPRDVLQATSVCRDTLRILNWYGGVELSPITWASFLENHPRLEAINAPVRLHEFGNSHIVLNSLKSVYIHCHGDPPASRDENGLWNIEFPNIRHAICDIVHPDSRIVYHHDFLQKIGPNLTSIQVKYTVRNGHSPFDSIDTTFQEIVVACPNLTRVDIVACEWLMPPFFLFPEMIHTLGIRVTLHQLPKCSANAFYGTMHEFISGFPSLKTIYFMDQRNIRTLRAYSQTFRSNLDRVITLGITVMDHEGHPLV